MRITKRILSMLLVLAMVLSILPLSIFAEEPATSNVAPKATASTTTCASWNKVSGVNDGQIPTQSQGNRGTEYGSWGQNNDCNPEMITLTWNSEVQLVGAGMYFWHDDGKDNRSGIDFPASYSFEYLDGEEWKAVSNAEGMLVDEDTMNQTSFDEITTTALRVVMIKETSTATYGLGVAEFEAYGSLLELDTATLEAAIAQAEAITNRDNYTDESVAALDEALNAARAVLAGDDKTQAEIDAAEAALLAAIAGLVIKPVDKPAEDNIAPEGTATAQYCASWNNVAGVNDGDVPAQSFGNQAGAYGSWGANNNANPEPITITFAEPAEITGAGMYFWHDGTLAAGKDDRDGIDFPASYTFAYLNDAGEYVPVTNARGMNNERDVVNYTVFDKVTTTALRVLLNKASTGSFGLGVAEFEIYGTFGSTVVVDTAALEAAIAEAEAIALDAYTDESAAALTEALEAAQAVLAKEDKTQDEVDAAAAALSAAIAALEEKPEETETPTYKLVTDLSAINANDKYVITLWRYFAGTNADSTKGYVFGSTANCSGVRADTADDYATITYSEGAYADTALWTITPVEGGYTFKNIGSGKYLGATIPADADEGSVFKIVSGQVNGVTNYCIGTDSTVIRYSGSSDRFSFNNSTPESQVTGTNACNALIYKVVSGDEPPAAKEHQIFTGSDIQGSNDWNQHLQNIARNASEAGHNIDMSVWCGDYADGSVYEDGSDTSATETPARIQYIKDTLGEYWSDIDFYFAQGNHDGSQHIGTIIDETGPKEFDDLILYQINEDDFPWWQAGYSTYSDEDVCLQKINATTATLSSYLDTLIAAEDQRVVFIYTHVPLHWTSRTTTMNSWWSDNIHADILFNMINEKAKDLDIVFLYGHNHSENYADAYPDGGTANFFAPGDEIRIPNGQVAASGNYTNEILNFTYLNAGYVGQTASGFSPSVSTASVITVKEDKVEFTRYSDAGHYDGSDRVLIRNNRGVYPAYLNLASVDNPNARKEGDSEQFKAVLKNGEAASYAWTVEGNGEITDGQDSDTVTVKYTGGGDVTVSVTVTYVEEEQNKSLTQSVTVSVREAPQPAEGITYAEVTSTADLAEGKKYAVVAWRYFGGSDTDTYNGYVFQSDNQVSFRAPTEDNYATIQPETDLPDEALWYIVPVEGGVTLQNIGTGKYLGAAIPAASDTPYTLTIAEGECNGVYNMAIGTASGSIRYSGSSGTFVYSTTAPSGEVGRAWAANLTVYEVVEPKNYVNIAPDGAVTAPNCASWSSADGVNDEIYPEASNNGDYNQAYGSWRSNATADPELITITFDKPAEITSARVFFWYNENDPHEQYGIDFPDSYTWEYLNDAGEWVTVPNAVGLGLEEDVFNDTTFDPITTTAFRIVMQRQAGSFGLGVAEIEIYGEYVTLNTAKLEAAIAAGDALKEEDYTPESWTPFTEALAAAKDTLVNAITQAAIDAAAAALNEAIAALVERTPDYVDKAELRRVIDEAEALDEAAYTPDSWAALAEALAAAKAAEADENATQEAVDAAAEALSAAIAALVDKVQAVIDMIDALDDPITLDSADALEEAREAFDALTDEEKARVTNYADLLLAEIDYYKLLAEQAAQEAEQAHEEEARAIREAKDAAIKALQEYEEHAEVGHDDAHIAAARVALAEAVEAIEAAQTAEELQQLVDAGIEAIDEALRGGLIEVDKSALEEAIEEAKAIDPALYTDESLAALNAALTQAEAIEAKEDATQEEVDAAAEALNAAIDALEEKGDEPPAVDKTELEAAIEDAEAVDADKYTDESVAALEEALEAAKTVAENPDATQEEVDKAAADLKAAIDALEEKGDEPPAVDKTELEAAIEEAKGVDADKYTDDSVAALNDALAKAEAVAAKEDATQEEVDKAAADLKAAIDALEEKPGDQFLFDDVKDESKFYFDPVYWAYYYEPQITDGKTETLFGPNDACTRGHVVTFLYRAAGKPAIAEDAENPFTDVEKGKFYYEAVLWAMANGITDGMTDTTFAPNATCTRGQIVTFLYRYEGKPAVAEDAENPFTDVAKGKFYYDAVLWASSNGITDGMTKTTFVPDGTCTRGQVVTFLYRDKAEQ